MEEAESLKVRKAGEGFLTLDGRSQRAAELHDLGQLDAFDVEATCRRRHGSDECDSRAERTETSDERRLRREKVTFAQKKMWSEACREGSKKSGKTSPNVCSFGPTVRSEGVTEGCECSRVARGAVCDDHANRVTPRFERRLWQLRLRVDSGF